VEEGNPIFEFDAFSLPSEEEFKRTINITDAVLDNQQRKLIRNGSVFAGSLSALTPCKLRGGQERRSCS
jgi:hypothetical protein